MSALADIVGLEQVLSDGIVDVFNTVDLVQKFCMVWARERFPDNKIDDIAVSTVADPVTGVPFTSIIQVGMPSIEEVPYTDENCTLLRFTYPITFDMEVKDEWDANQNLEFTNSRDLFMAIYLKSRRAFKEGHGKNLGGWANATHSYLQQDSVVTAEDDETGGRMHSADWSLVVTVTGLTL